MKTVIFQGDSVTDAERNRSNNENCGMGYATLVKARLGYDNPGKYRFINRGVSGNRMIDLYARVKRDTINMAPDAVSFLIGVNDVLHEYVRGDGFGVKRYKELYIMMIEDILEALPSCKIMIMEPFILHGVGTDSDGAHPGRWEFYSSKLPEYQKAAKEVAEHFDVPFISLQKLISEAAQTAGDSLILGDGIHPISEGHELIAREWIRTFESITEEWK